LRPRAIHQFHAGSATGDGVTSAMFFIQRLLRDAGHHSEIYCLHVDPALYDRILPYATYQDDPADLLLAHYSMGSETDAWVSSRRSPRVLIYHNITPARFFPAGSELARFSEAGRRQLARWAADKTFAGAIADSSFNADELSALGFADVAAIGLLVDLEHIRTQPWNPAVASETAGARTLLFIGRMAPHKNQAALVRMMPKLIALSDAPVRLLLAGAVADPGYAAEVAETIRRQSLADHVRLLGARSDEDILALFRLADLYVSASEHEGFGMPLVEAMAFDLPVLAVAGGSVAATLGAGGLVLDDASPDRMAAAAKLVLQEPGLRRRIIQGQRESLSRFSRADLVAALEQHLHQAGFDVALGGTPQPTAAAPRRCVVEGPFDSAYSLAAVNRGLARALVRAGESVALVSRDGAAPFAPDPAFLQANPDLQRMTANALNAAPVDVRLRNQYPPSVADMRGAMRVLANYAWEESGFPTAWTTELNATVDLVTVTSAYVARTLRDNGVAAPIAVVGNGVDPLPAPRRPTADDRFRFLHVSSGFPRKGLDALLVAWAAAFGAEAGVDLVIKTFPNIHNTIGDALAAFRAAHPAAAPITLIDEEIAPDALAALYASSDALVCPSRGEGFGLPLAEAMAMGIPVITTGFGGQTDFCTDETAWLIDYSFAYARTHLGIPNSVWVEPDPVSLTRAMRDVLAASPTDRARRTEAGQALIGSRFTWDDVARRTQAAIGRVRDMTGAEGLAEPVIGLVSSWNVRCGIADYARSQTGGIGAHRLKVFADRTAHELQPDGPAITRCWVQDWQDPLVELFGAICASGVDAVVIQFNFGFFHIDSFRALLDRLHRRGTPVFIVFHSTQDVFKPEMTFRLTDIRDSLASARRLLVHSVHDLNRLKAIGLADKAALFPMGLPQRKAIDRTALRRAQGMDGRTVIASFGYLLPHKGLRELVAAFALLRRTVPDAHLLMLNALYPVSVSDAELEAIQQDIATLGLADHVTLVTDFIDEASLLERLGAADLIVYPYQETQESASAAVRMGLASLTPVAVTPLPIFADVEGVAHRLPGLAPQDIAEGIATALLQADDAGFAARQADWVAAHAWPILSRRLDGLIRGELLPV
jgi:glycosyltransferase involved in cell wall biosynthesis